MKIQFNPFFNSSLLISSLFIAQTSMAANFSTQVEAKAGYDTNPYRLNDQFSIEGSDYLDYLLKAKLKFHDDFSLTAKLSHQDYNNTPNWADNQTFDTNLRYQTGKFSNRTGIGLSYKKKDKTYVSRLKGSTSQYSGKSLDNRYNYQQVSLNAFKNFKLLKRVYNQVDLDIAKKDYSDFSQLNITNFDYLGLKLTNTLLIKANRRNKHSFILSYESRIFDDREQKDIRGTELADTKMIFNYLGADYQYRYKLSKHSQVKFEAGFTQRTDNGSGYYDSKKFNSAISSKVKWHKSSHLELKYRFSDFAYLREPEISQTSNEEDFTSEVKHKVSLTNTSRLPKSWFKNAHLLFNYSYVMADSNRSQYQYQRQMINAGFKFAF